MVSFAEGFNLGLLLYPSVVVISYKKCTARELSLSINEQSYKIESIKYIKMSNIDHQALYPFNNMMKMLQTE